MMAQRHNISRSMRGLLLGTALTILPPGTVWSQETGDDSGGMLTSFLEDTLSSDSRYISVSGLEGAFSSKATIETLTVSDENGPWLVVEGATLDWNRLALLRGRFSVNTLSADVISVLRSPDPVPEDPELPTPEATPFALPELPVAIELGTFSVGRVDLGEDLLGQRASLSLDGTLKLADGALDTRLEVARLDKPGDRLNLIAAYANETRQIDLDLTLSESADGLVARSLNLPGRPTVALQVQGSGPVSDFQADLRLATNGNDRLGGQVILAATPTTAPPADSAPPQPAGIGFSADLKGDIDPLLQPAYRPFFGPDLHLVLRGATQSGGGVIVDTLALNTRALHLSGALATTSDTSLASANLRARIAAPEGQASVILPVPGADTTLAGANLTLQKVEGADWTIEGQLDRFSQPDLRIATAQISAKGMLVQQPELNLNGRLSASLKGVVPSDPALAAAVGPDLTLSGNLSTQGPAALQFEDFTLAGDDYTLGGVVAASGLNDGLKLAADVTAKVQDLTQFSDISGQSLGGSAKAKLTAQYVPLTGAFDTDVSLIGLDLSAGIEQVDQLLLGQSRLNLVARRNEEGLALDLFDLAAKGLRAEASGHLNSKDGAMSIMAQLEETDRLLPGMTGPLTLQSDLSRKGDELRGAARLTGPNSSFANLNGTVAISGDAQIDFDAALNELERFVPELPGPVSVKGQATRSGGLWTIASDATAPAGARSTLSGSFDETSGEADLRAEGSARLEGANPFIKPNLLNGAANFDLILKGVPTLDALSGTITTAGATAALPAANLRIEDIGARIALANSRASLNVTARPGASGTVTLSGPVALLPPFDGNIAIALNALTLSDKLTYDTVLNGQLALSGALASNSRLAGQIQVGETNFNLNTAGGSVTSAPIPPVRHINESAAQRQTRARAGLIETASSSATGGGPEIALDVLIDAPGRIFARGRGLRAELGGRVQLRGTVADLAPSGQISLIRGTFDILGRRLNLDEGRISLLGDLKPYLEFSSSASTDQGTATLEITGPVDGPEIKVTSDPPRPSEEALALLLFGDNIQDLSPLALARLAGSALQLSGRGGRAQERLREGTGADDAEIGLDSLGSGNLGIGGYISQNVYTDVDVNTRGESEVTINLDVTDNFTVTGTVDSEGETGVGVFFKRDY